MTTSRTPGATLAAATLLLLAACAAPPRPDPRQLGEKETAELAALGARAFGIRWEGKVVGARERGVSAVTDGVTTLTSRAATRVFIVHNRRQFPPTDANGFGGSDDELRSIGRRILEAAGVPVAQIADMQVLQQFVQVGESVEGGKEMRLQAPRRSHRSLLVNRRIDGVEVVSSRLLLNVDADGRVAFMELNWPDFAPEVLERAARLRAAADARYEAPSLEGAEVEAVQPVVLHSPAVGFYNDATAALRVIYRPTARQVGQKAVRYLDERGADVVLPRDIDRPREEPARRVARSQ